MGASFPRVTIRDMVSQQCEVLKQLGVSEIVSVIGGSMGGMTAIEFGLVAAPHVRSVISLSSSGRHQPWQIGISECQRAAIYADPKWQGGMYHQDDPPTAGLSVARMMAMLTYRTHPAYWTKFGRDEKEQAQVGPSRPTPPSQFEVESYLRAQGNKFNERGFDAGSYVRLTEAMDSHDLGRNRPGGYEEVLRNIKIPVLIASISSDVLYPVSEQLELAQYMPNAQHHMIESPEGHDGFLLEGKKIGLLIRGFLGQMEYEEPVHRGPLDKTLMTTSKL
jgi:homoserine O-acetyltransferase